MPCVPGIQFSWSLLCHRVVLTVTRFLAPDTRDTHLQTRSTCMWLQVHCDDMAGEYVRHFTQAELVVGAAAEARLAKTLVQRVGVPEALAVAAAMVSSASCVVKAEHHRGTATEEQLLEVPRLPASSVAGPN